MPVPYSFAQYPNGSVIPLGQLDANFAYIETQIAGGGGQVLSVVQGGTGATTPNGAMANLLPIQTGAAGQFLTTDGNGILSWAPASGGGGTIVSSFSAGTTGFTPSVSTAGTIVLSGTLNIAHGGTGATTQSGAINALMPSQTGQSGKFLITDGTNISWASGVPGSGTVTSVNLSGASTGLTFAGGPITTSGIITLGGVLSVSAGGTGSSSLPAQGQLLIGNGSSYTLNTLVAGSNITITNGPGTITIDATGGGGGGGVTDISFGSTGLTPSTTTSGSVTVAGTLNIANGGTGSNNSVSALNALLPSQTGNANKVLKTDGAGTVSWTNNTALATGNYGAISVASASPGPASWSINNSYITPIMLSTGGPSWTSSGVLSASNFVASGGTGSTLTLFSSSTSYSVYSSGGASGFIRVNTPSGNYLSVTNFAAAGVEATGAYTNVSDASLKENVSKISESLEIVKKLTGVYFNWVFDDGKSKQVGLIAQDVQKALPEVVSVTTSKKLGVAYASIVPVLINAINELEARVTALEAKG